MTSDHQRLWKVAVTIKFFTHNQRGTMEEIEDYEAPSSLLSNT
jgi:hypothetical protein